MNWWNNELVEKLIISLPPSSNIILKLKLTIWHQIEPPWRSTIKVI